MEIYSRGWSDYSPFQEGRESILVSIIIVMYNSSATIKACLESVLHSSFQGYEVILVDNHSRDDTVKCCREVLSQTCIPYHII
ncbi:MAG: glycosyltransferase family 2 protein, partial [Candidatus Caldatribacteriaceae bacterium]